MDDDYEDGSGIRLRHMLILHILLFAVFLKVINPGFGLYQIFWVTVFSTLVMVIHEFGHFIVWTLFGVHLVRIRIIPMIAFGVLPDPDDVAELSPLQVLLVALGGPVVNLAVGLYAMDKWPTLGGALFAWFNLLAFATNVFPFPFTDGGLGTIVVFQATSDIKKSFLRVLGISSLVFLITMRFEILIFSIIFLAIMLTYQLVVFWLRNEEYDSDEDSFLLEIILAVFIGLGGAVFIPTVPILITYIHSIWANWVLPFLFNLWLRLIT